MRSFVSWNGRLLSPRWIWSLVLVLPLAVSPSTALAQFVPGDALIDPALGGVTQYDRWLGLTASNYPGYPGFPGTAPWPAPIGSNEPGSGDAILSKTANGSGGGPLLSSAGIYFGGFSSTINNPGGTLSVSDSTPAANLATVAFQIQIGEAWTYDFLNDALPTLSYNGGSQQLVVAQSQLLEAFDNGTVTMPSGEETVYINTYLFTWDVSSLGPIADFRIDFSAVQHAQVYGLQLDQSDVPLAAVPEPGTWALAGTLLGAVAWGWRRKKRRQQPQSPAVA